MLHRTDQPRQSTGRARYSLMIDQGGAVAFEMPFVILFIFFSFLIPLADFAIFGYKYISGFQALRDAGQYMQYHPPADVTVSPYTLPSAASKIGNYSITGALYCGGLTVGDLCSTNTASVLPKYYTLQTKYTLAPSSLMRPVLCGSANPSCTFTLTYSERFQ